jgi:hypothetical protein
VEKYVGTPCVLSCYTFKWEGFGSWGIGVPKWENNQHLRKVMMSRNIGTEREKM